MLYLVGKNKMNLYDVNIMELIDQYTATIRTLQANRMDVSSEFIDMAAHLAFAAQHGSGTHESRADRTSD